MNVLNFIVKEIGSKDAKCLWEYHRILSDPGKLRSQATAFNSMPLRATEGPE